MVIGIDEVGRGSLAGPLVVGLVSLNTRVNGLRDSKQLSVSQRIKLTKKIYTQADFAALGRVWPHEIDMYGLTHSMTMAINRALPASSIQLKKIIIDGNYNYLPELRNVETLIRGDDLVPSISAASVIAKVARDNYMSYLDRIWPSYGFKSHVGYGTANHLSSLAKYGPSPIHRLSFKPIRTQLDLLVKN